MAVEPVCGMTVNPAKAAARFDHKGTTYYFCSKGWAAKFAADPVKYLAGAREPMAPNDSHRSPVISRQSMVHPSVPQPSVPQPSHQPSAISHQPLQEWTCPMDPDVVSDRPGACAKCAMALEPRVATLADAPKPEHVDTTRRRWIG